jgi:hypothetical protein
LQRSLWNGLHNYFPRRFLPWRGAFFGAAEPRAGLLLLVGYAIRYRLRGSIGLCLGIAAGNGLYILLVVVSSDLLRQMPLLVPPSNCWVPFICCESWQPSSAQSREEAPPGTPLIQHVLR